MQENTSYLSDSEIKVSFLLGSVLRELLARVQSGMLHKS